jgi:hypothetical protein
MMKLALKRPAIKKPVMRKPDIRLPTTPKRFAAIVLLAVAILASVVYWVLRLRADQAAPVSVPMTASAPPSATTALFGDRPDLLPSAANLSITGVIIASDPQDSIAIVVEAGQRPRALRVGASITGGLHLSEVRPRYVVVSDGERSTRIGLPERAAQAATDTAAGAGTETPAAVAPVAPDSESAVGTPVEGSLRGEPPHRSGDQGAEPDGSEATQ